MVPIYSRVRLLTDRFISEGVGPGASGYVIEVYDNGAYEVEFSAANGETIAQVVAQEHEIAVFPEEAEGG